MLQEILTTIYYLWSACLLFFCFYVLITEKEKSNRITCMIIVGNGLSMVFWIMTIISYILKVTLLPKTISITFMMFSVILLILFILFIKKIKYPSKS